jgi:hypothetical protein
MIVVTERRMKGIVPVIGFLRRKIDGVGAEKPQP